MTVYFPLVVHGAMLVEPTETESRPASTVHHGDGR
jgi:glycine cleavage system protein P-like pyridoxal-binding family